MKQAFTSPRFLFITIAILVATISRLLPHPPNFSPIAAMALFGGAYLSNKKTAFLLPFLAMFLSDLVIGFHDTMWAVYLSFAIIVALGLKLQQNIKPSSIVLSTVLASTLFFIITNFAVWLGNPFYPQNLSGLIGCYASAIPFYQNDLFGSFALNTYLGDIFFTAVLFGSFYLAKLRFPVLAKV